MKTNKLLIAHLCALVLAAASHAALPKGRVGAIPIECEEAFAIPEVLAQGESVTDREWKMRFSFHYGRADQVIYRKADGADISQPEVHDLLGLNGGKRQWTGRKSSNVTSWWKTDDGLLSAALDPAGKTLTVATTLRGKREENSYLSHRQDALAVWDLGVHLGIISANLLKDPKATKASGQLGAARKELLGIGALQPAVAADLVELPELPEMTGDGKADLQAIMKFAGTGEVAIAKALAKVEAPGPNEVNLKSCFKLGFLLPSWAMFYRAGLPAAKSDLAKEYSKLLQASQLPETLDSFGLGTRAASGMSAEDFETSARETTKQMGKHLASMLKELKDLARKRMEIHEVKHTWLAGLWYGRIFLDLQLRDDLAAARQDAEAVEKWLAKTSPAQSGPFLARGLPKFTAETGQRERDLNAAWILYQEKTYREICLILNEDEVDELIPYRLVFDIARAAQVGQVKGPKGEMAKIVKDLETYFTRCESLLGSGWREPLAAAKALASKGPSAQPKFGTEMRTLIRAVSLSIDEQQAAVGPAVLAETFAPPTVESMPPQPEDGPQELLPPAKSRIRDNPEPSAILNPEPSAVIGPTKIGPGGKITTPQAEIDKDGNIIVPGLGGMKFMANGDIFGSDGKKLFDAAKNAWAPGVFEKGASEKDKQSQTASVPPVLIGETSAQLTARLGKPEMLGSSYIFRQAGWRIVVELHEDRADSVVWRKPLGAVGNFTSEALYAMVKNPDPDLQALRRLHAAEKQWVKIESNTLVIRKGQVVRSRIADFEPDAKALADTNLLYLPDVTWRSGSLRFNFEVSESDGTLEKVLRIITQDYENRRRAKTPAATEK